MYVRKQVVLLLLSSKMIRGEKYVNHAYNIKISLFLLSNNLGRPLSRDKRPIRQSDFLPLQLYGKGGGGGARRKRRRRPSPENGDEGTGRFAKSGWQGFLYWFLRNTHGTVCSI